MLGLMIPGDQDLISKLKVSVKMAYNLAKNSDRTGGVWWMDSYRSPIDFDIEIDGCCNWATTLTSLAHELVHVKQMALGEWTQNEHGTSNRWLGQLIDVSKYHYRDLPWEIDAYGREAGLYIRFDEWFDGKDIRPLPNISPDTQLLVSSMAGTIKPLKL